MEEYDIETNMGICSTHNNVRSIRLSVNPGTRDDLSLYHNIAKCIIQAHQAYGLTRHVFHD
jgi:hypothetical protein